MADPLFPALVGAVVLILLLAVYLFSGNQKPISGKIAAAKSIEVVAHAAPEIDKPCVRILYGTQTGTAERQAKQTGNEICRKYGDAVHCAELDIENYLAETRLAGENVVLFLMATYGDGEPTDNAAEFYSWLTTKADAVQNGEEEPFLQVSSNM